MGLTRRSNTVSSDLLQRQLDVIFNFSQYEELKQAVQQLIRENLGSETLDEEAHDLFESWWASSQAEGHWNETVKQQMWTSLWMEFGQTNSADSP